MPHRLARIALAAHLATCTARDDRGPVTSESIGGVRRTFAALTSGGLASTTLGQTYRAIVESSLEGVRLV